LNSIHCLSLYDNCIYCAKPRENRTLTVGNLEAMENADATSQSDVHIDYKTPKKTHSLIDSEQLLDKINILTTKPENHSQNAKVRGGIANWRLPHVGGLQLATVANQENLKCL